MKKYILPLFFIVLALTILSWGVTGHKTIAQIAENHLNEKAKNGVQILLGNQSMSDVASWADEVRNNPEYKNTASWHFLNLPLGLTYNQFVVAVSGQDKENVYSALNKCRAELIDKTSTAEQKTVALKFIIHLVGDLHQPMHISRAEDKGGNTIQVTYDGKGTNLHSLWDSKLLEHQNMTYQELAKSYDTATDEEIKQWQSDNILKWIFESYQISSQLYREIDLNKNIDDDYYKSHLPIIQQRIEKGGIRLAGMLNSILKDDMSKAMPIAGAKPIVNEPYAPLPLPSNEVGKHIGETVSVNAIISDTHLIESSNMLLLNIGAGYPNQDFTVMIKGVNISKIVPPGMDLKGKTIVVTGTVIQYKGKAEIEVTESSQLIIFHNIGNSGSGGG